MPSLQEDIFSFPGSGCNFYLHKSGPSQELIYSPEELVIENPVQEGVSHIWVKGKVYNLEGVLRSEDCCGIGVLDSCLSDIRVTDSDLIDKMKGKVKEQGTGWLTLG